MIRISRRREQVLSLLRVAGYHADMTTFTRVYVENRVRLVVARDAYRTGEQARAAGIPCSCSTCKESKP